MLLYRRVTTDEFKRNTEWEKFAFLTAKGIIYSGDNNQLMVKSLGKMLKNLMIKESSSITEPTLIVYITKSRTIKRMYSHMWCNRK